MMLFELSKEGKTVKEKPWVAVRAV
jgi:hypothetical protein